MNNAERRRIVQEAKMNGYQGSYVDLFRQAAQNPEGMQKPLFTAVTSDQKEQGLRPLHEAGRTDASMAFPDVPPNTPFNTVGMKAPIDIKKYDKQGHLVKSYENVPPGIQNLDTGPNVGTVLETPSRMQGGGFKPSFAPPSVNQFGSLDARGNVVYSRAERDALFPDGTPAQKQRQQAKEATGTGVFESIRMMPGAGELIDFAEVGYAYLTGKDFYGEPTNAGALGGTALAGILVPNIVEKPAKAAIKKLKNSPMAKDIEKGYDQLMDWFSSDEYKLRLRSEGRSPDLADEAVRRLGESNVVIKPDLPHDGRGIGPSVKGGKGYVEFKEGAPDVENLSVHEFGHRSNYADPAPEGYRYSGADFSDMVTPPKFTRPKGMSDGDFFYYSNPDEVRSRSLETLMYMKRTGKSFDELVEIEKIGGWSRDQLPSGTRLLIGWYKDTPKGLKRFNHYLNKMLGVSVAVGAGAAAAEAGEETGSRNKKQTGGYNPNEYMNKMEPKVFPNQKRDAKWVNYATQHDFAGRFPGETRTNEQIGLERSNRNTVPLVPNLVRPKELKRAQEGAFASDNTRVSMPELQDQEAFNPYSDLHLPPSGRIDYSPVNVEDLLGVGQLIKPSRAVKRYFQKAADEGRNAGIAFRRAQAQKEAVIRNERIAQKIDEGVDIGYDDIYKPIRAEFQQKLDMGYTNVRATPSGEISRSLQNRFAPLSKGPVNRFKGDISRFLDYDIPRLYRAEQNLFKRKLQRKADDALDEMIKFDRESGTYLNQIENLYRPSKGGSKSTGSISGPSAKEKLADDFFDRNLDAPGTVQNKRGGYIKLRRKRYK